jgi:hypothetical protein
MKILQDCEDEVLETPKRGIDFGKLYRYDDCDHGKFVGAHERLSRREFQNEPCLGFKPTGKNDFLLHIIKSLEMLSVVGLVHHDLFMRNIIIDHFKSETSITNPILIDFGEVEKSDQAEKDNAKSFHFIVLLLWKSNERYKLDIWKCSCSI